MNVPPLINHSNNIVEDYFFSIRSKILSKSEYIEFAYTNSYGNRYTFSYPYHFVETIFTHYLPSHKEAIVAVTEGKHHDPISLTEQEANLCQRLRSICEWYPNFESIFKRNYLGHLGEEEPMISDLPFLLFLAENCPKDQPDSIHYFLRKVCNVWEKKLGAPTLSISQEELFLLKKIAVLREEPSLSLTCLNLLVNRGRECIEQAFRSGIPMKDFITLKPLMDSHREQLPNISSIRDHSQIFGLL